MKSIESVPPTVMPGLSCRKPNVLGLAPVLDHPVGAVTVVMVVPEGAMYWMQWMLLRSWLLFSIVNLYVVPPEVVMWACARTDDLVSADGTATSANTVIAMKRRRRKSASVTDVTFALEKHDRTGAAEDAHRVHCAA